MLSEDLKTANMQRLAYGTQDKTKGKSANRSLVDPYTASQHTILPYNTKS